MPVKKEDAHRALELLEQYHSKLTKPQDRQLRNAIERVIRVFKGRLFQALLDIQEYYELTLLNDTKSVEEKTQETNQVVSRWERNPPILINTTSNNNNSHRNFNYSIDSEEPLPAPPQSDDAIYGKPNKTSSGKVSQPKTPVMTSASNNGVEKWEYEEIVLERGPSGLGFSIAGGLDNPHIGDDPSIYITKLIDGGTAVTDGRLKVNDILVSVNDISTVNVTHAQCVDALKKTTKHVKLVVKRLLDTTEQVVAVELVKAGRGLGFSIAGGVGNQHVPGDNGIFITKLTEGGTAEESGMLGVGDRLISVNDMKLANITHEEAVMILKSTNDRVKLLVGKPKGSLQPDRSTSASKDHITSPSVAVAEKQHKQSVEKPVKTAKKTKSNKSAANEEAKDGGTGMPSRGPRKIVLKKGSSGLGFNIVGGEEAEGIFVSFILQGGPADLSGKLHKGDQILSVNDIDLRHATHEQAAAVLKGAGDQVDILAQYRIDEYNQFEAKIHDLREQMMNASSSSLKSTNQNKSLFVRALFNYNADDDADNPGKGMSFKFGDVFHVINALDNDWWQVQKVIPDDETPGIIPSQHRVERMERAKLKGLKAEKNKKKKKRRDSSNDQLNESEVADETVLSYEPMIQKEVDYARPVIILGPLKDQLNDDLLSEYPQFFENCIPHTTRPKKEDEVDGRDYYFVASREQMEHDIENHLFIEAGQYKDNLYGTSVQSVRDVASRDHHCVLDVSGHAIKRLRTADLHPIAILIKPLTPANVRQWNAKVSEEQAQKTYEKALKFEQEFGLDFTAVVSGESFDEIYEEVKTIIQNHSGSIILVPAPREDEQ